MIKPYYQDDLATIYCTDSRKVLPKLEYADVILTDPQFFLPPVAHRTKGGGQWFGSLGDLVMIEEAYKWLFDESQRILSDSGHLYINCHDRSYPIFFRLAYTRWEKSQMIVWYKPSGRIGRGWRRAHELILHASNKAAQYTDGFRLNVVGIMPVRTMRRGHPAEKPGELGDFILEAVPSPGILVDPFMGSGTYIFSAIRNGFQAIGIELEERYCEAVARKLQKG